MPTSDDPRRPRRLLGRGPRPTGRVPDEDAAPGTAPVPGAGPAPAGTEPAAGVRPTPQAGPADGTGLAAGDGRRPGPPERLSADGGTAAGPALDADRPLDGAPGGRPEPETGPAGRDSPAPPRALAASHGDVDTAVPGEAPEPASEGPEPTGGEGADAAEAADGDEKRFTVRLDNFEGPFDLLLQLISKHKLDVTEVALSKVTDEFMAHIRAMGPDWDLDATTEFLVVAATLLDLKTARLLPTAEVEDEADLALLEARDLLFARLLQYRAYKRVAAIFADRLELEARRHARTVALDPQLAELLPEVVIRIGADTFARLAATAMQPRPVPQVYVEHIHAPLVSVREQAEVVVARLRELGEATFGDLTADAPDTLTVVARFLALLELYRERAVVLDQDEALGALTVRWTGGDDAEQPHVTDEFDREPEPVPDEPVPDEEEKVAQP